MKIERKGNLNLNNVNDTDSYKFSHFVQYPPGMERMTSYLTARGGEYAHATIVGLQPLLHRYIAQPTTADDVRQAAVDAEQHGVPFNYDGWMHIVDAYGGRLPVRIRAIPEGTVVPVQNVLMTVESVRDPKCFWVVNWLETQLSRVWYPSTVAMASRSLRRMWLAALERSSDDPMAEVDFKHHDFGSRGVTCREQAELGGLAHLMSFMGSDTLAGVKLANHYYDSAMAGFSIPATEHSTMTVWGRDGERAALINWIRRTLIERTVPAGQPKLSACVGDSYNIFRFVDTLCDPAVLDLIRASSGTFVLRPDSGNPSATIITLLQQFQRLLPTGSVRTNGKGYLVLPSYLRIIWGDGINRRSTVQILQDVMNAGWSASNIAFGSGGGLLMDFNRDTQSFAFKCSHALVDGHDVNVVKDPSTDRNKRSRGGRLDLVLNDGEYATVTMSDNATQHERSELVTVFDMGDIVYHNTLHECRARLRA